MIPYELNKVHCVDCLEALKQLPDKCVDLVLTDPPYGNDNNYDDLQARWEFELGSALVSSKHGIAPRPIANDGKEQRHIFKQIVEQSARLLCQNGTFVTCCGGGGGAKGLQFVDWSMIVDELLTFKAAIVWDKGKIGMGWHYRRSYEMLLVAMNGSSCKWRDDTLQVENIIRHIPKIIPSSDQHPTEMV